MDRLNWKEYFCAIAAIASLRSQDKFRKVGAVCISDKNRVLSCGYNGLVAGKNPPGDFYENRENPDRFLYTIHAEANALSLCKPNEVHTIATTHSPCSHCALMIATYGVKRVLFIEEYPRDTRYKEIFKFYNIDCEQVNIPPIFCKDILDILPAPPIYSAWKNHRIVKKVISQLSKLICKLQT